MQTAVEACLSKKCSETRDPDSSVLANDFCLPYEREPGNSKLFLAQTFSPNTLNWAPHFI